MEYIERATAFDIEQQCAYGDYISAAVDKKMRNEYDPADYSALLAPILEGHADAVFGSRFMGAEAHRVVYFWHMVGNKFLTLLSNMCTNVNLTDMETGYKVFRREILQQIKIEEERFGFEPEITAKVARLKGIRIYEPAPAFEETLTPDERLRRQVLVGIDDLHLLEDFEEMLVSVQYGHGNLRN